MLYLQRTVNMISIPFITTSLKVARFTRKTVDVYLNNMSAARENRELRNRVFQLRTELTLQRNLERENQRLRSLLGLKYTLQSRSTAASVIGNTSFSGASVIIIDRGERDGIEPNMAVVCESGVVGRVWKVFPSQSHVQLISDPTASLGVKLAGTEIGGILAGIGDPREGEMKYVPNGETVEVDVAVVTSGSDGIFPRGVPVGKVIQRSPTSDFFQRIKVRFAAPLTDLSQVLVLPPASGKPEGLS